jgi:DNA-binding protein H-NS
LLSIGDGFLACEGLLFAPNTFNSPNVRNNILEGEMPKASSNLGTMSVDALLELRDKIGAVLSQRGTELRRQLQRLDVVGGRLPGKANGKGGARNGGKLPPKYRDPDDRSNVWAGRGALPRWMEAKIKGGAKREDFLIAADGAPRKKRAAKKARKPAKAISPRKKRRATAASSAS